MPLLRREEKQTTARRSPLNFLKEVNNISFTKTTILKERCLPTALVQEMVGAARTPLPRRKEEGEVAPIHHHPEAIGAVAPARAAADLTVALLLEGEVDALDLLRVVDEGCDREAVALVALEVVRLPEAVE